MNKNNKLINWRIVKKLFATFLFGAILISSCNKEDSTVGSSINPNGLNVVTSDTFTVKTYSSLLDSLESDETSVSMLGAYNDPEFGLVDCGIVSQLRLSSESPNFGVVSSVDSVVLSFVYSGIKYYGKVDDLTFEVYEINEELDLDDEYYTFTPVSNAGSNLVLPGFEVIKPELYTDIIVGSDTLSPQLRLRLDPAFGQYLIDNVSSMSSNDVFTSFFNGVYVKVTDGSNLASGDGHVVYLSLEDAISKMVIYYTNSSSENKTFSFNINNKCARFNKIDFDRSGTNVEAVLNNPELGEEKFYMQSSSIKAVIEFPYIMDL